MGNTLSFSVTPSEQRRASLIEAVSGIHVDPRGRADAIMTIVIASIYVFDLAAVVYMFFNRNYPPIRCKSPILMTGVIVSSAIWFLGDLHINGHVPLGDTPWNNCKAFAIWMSALLGVYTLSSLIAIRIFGLIRVFIVGQQFRGRGLYLALLLWAGSMLLYGLVVQFLPAEKTLFYVPLADMCNSTKGLQAAIFAVIGSNWLVVLALGWYARNIKSSFNEVLESAVGCFLIFLVLITSIVMHYSRPAFPLSAGYRIMVTCIDQSSTQIYWWIIMGVPLYNCLFRRERYLREWTRKLMGDGLQKEYEVSDPGFSVNTTLVGRASNAISMAPMPSPRHNDSHRGVNHLQTPIIDHATSTENGEPISWPQLADYQQANEPPSSKHHIRRW
ncbi:hypothetical protein IWQ56_004283 [Coemansia nantahalensis]|nr:hypothetical protein IWQ56_004283 [Coemansia nantahalensis]